MYLLLVWLPAPSSRICSLHFEQKDITNNRISPTIAFCRDELQLQDFAGSEATCEFLLTFNDLFDVLNSKSKYGKFLKGPLSESSHKYWKPVLDNARKYILGLRHSTGNKRLVNGPRKQPFLGFVSLIDAVYLLYDEYVVNGELEYILTFKLSQGPYMHMPYTICVLITPRSIFFIFILSRMYI